MFTSTKTQSEKDNDTRKTRGRKLVACPMITLAFLSTILVGCLNPATPASTPSTPNPAPGSLDTGFLATGIGANNFVSSIAVQADGKILIGGGFTSYNGILWLHCSTKYRRKPGHIALPRAPGKQHLFSIAVQSSGNTYRRLFQFFQRYQLCEYLRVSIPMAAWIQVFHVRQISLRG